MGQGYSAEQWREWIEEQPQSGMTVFDFCRAVGVSPQSFYRRRARLAEALEEPASKPAESLVPLRLVAASGLEIDLPCGATIRVPREERLIREVLTVLLDGSPPC